MIKCDDYFTDHQNQLRVKTVHEQEWFTGQPLDRVFCRCYISPHHPGKSPVCTGPVPGEIWWLDWFSHGSVVNKNHQNNQADMQKWHFNSFFFFVPNILNISNAQRCRYFFFMKKISLSTHHFDPLVCLETRQEVLCIIFGQLFDIFQSADEI